MRPACGRAARLSLASLGGHATEAERLELEAHLAACSRCSAEHTQLGVLRVLQDAEPTPLSGAARERVRRALLARPARVPAPARRLLWPVGAVGLVAAAAIALWLAGRNPARLRVLGGDVVVVLNGAPAAAARMPDSTPPGDRDEGVTLRSVRGGRAQLDDAATELGGATELVWRRRQRSVELRQGAVTIEVQHRPGQRFEVRTARFLVEVIGTRFTVDLDGVRTERGTVRVLSPDGTLIGYVGAGRSWAAPDRAVNAATAPILPAAVAVAAVPAPAPSLAPAPVAAGLDVMAEIGPRARLERARRALARGNAAEARRAVEPVFRAGREAAAEARAIYAESFLTEGRYADAVDGYEIVVRDFPSTPQAESALYAIAQLESEHGRPGGARVTLQRYLSRYPHGRFAKEAADRLAGLPVPPR